MTKVSYFYGTEQQDLSRIAATIPFVIQSNHQSLLLIN